MNAPHRISDTAFLHIYYEHMRTRYEPREGVLACRTCHALVQYLTAYISIHSTFFNVCAGSGEVRQMSLPYCPNCEGIPDDSGCFHVL